MPHGALCCIPFPASVFVSGAQVRNAVPRRPRVAGEGIALKCGGERADIGADVGFSIRIFARMTRPQEMHAMWFATTSHVVLSLLPGREIKCMNVHAERKRQRSLVELGAVLIHSLVSSARFSLDLI